MARLRLIHGGAKYIPDREIRLSKKAQLYLQYSGMADLDHLKTFMALRDAYMQARTTENINRITTYELENVIRNGLTLATHVNLHKPRKQA